MAPITFKESLITTSVESVDLIVFPAIYMEPNVLVDTMVVKFPGIVTFVGKLIVNVSVALIEALI